MCNYGSRIIISCPWLRNPIPPGMRRSPSGRTSATRAGFLLIFLPPAGCHILRPYISRWSHEATLQFSQMMDDGAPKPLLFPYWRWLLDWCLTDWTDSQRYTCGNKKHLASPYYWMMTRKELIINQLGLYEPFFITLLTTIKHSIDHHQPLHWPPWTTI